MIIDVTGIELTPGNNGNTCLGNGKHFDPCGNLIEICCDECNYYLCCIETTTAMCEHCTDQDCPRSAKKTLKQLSSKVFNFFIFRGSRK